MAKRFTGRPNPNVLVLEIRVGKQADTDIQYTDSQTDLDQVRQGNLLVGLIPMCSWTPGQAGKQQQASRLWLSCAEGDTVFFVCLPPIGPPILPPWPSGPYGRSRPVLAPLRVPGPLSVPILAPELYSLWAFLGPETAASVVSP